MFVQHSSAPQKLSGQVCVFYAHAVTAGAQGEWMGVGLNVISRKPLFVAHR